MFYRLRHELEKPGCFASRQLWQGDLDNPAGEHHLRADAFPDFQPEFSPVILTGDSSPVDFVDDGAIGGQGLLVSEKVLEIFGRMKLPPYQPYRVEVVHRGKPVAKRYFWVQILSLDNYGWIDFARSQFTRKSHLDMDDESKGEPLQVGSERQLKGLVERSGPEDFWVLFRRISFNGVYARSPFDLFFLERLGGVPAGFPLVNDRLRRAFEQEGVAGYRLIERPEIVVDAA
jgi:hypothetical protein